MTAAPRTTRKVNRGTRSKASPNFSLKLTPALTSSLIAKHFPKLNPPNSCEILKLATHLQMLKARVKIERGIHREAHRRLFEAQEAMAKLQDLMPHFAQQLTESLEILADSTEDFAHMRIEKQAALALVEGLLVNIVAIKASPELCFSPPVAPASKVIFQDRWHYVVIDIYRFYTAALSTANPGTDFKVHGEGPGGKFLSDAITYITGEKVAPATVQKKVTEILSRRKAA